MRYALSLLSILTTFSSAINLWQKANECKRNKMTKFKLTMGTIMFNYDGIKFKFRYHFLKVSCWNVNKTQTIRMKIWGWNSKIENLLIFWFPFLFLEKKTQMLILLLLGIFVTHIAHVPLWHKSNNNCEIYKEYAQYMHKRTFKPLFYKKKMKKKLEWWRKRMINDFLRNNNK